MAGDLPKIATFCFLCCGITIPIVLLPIGEILIPTLVQTAVFDGLSNDKQSTVDEWDQDYEADAWVVGTQATIVVFNLTNAYDLLSTNPAPKPHFEAVEVQMLESSLDWPTRE